MPRAGRELEVLVATLESLLGRSDGVEVESPAFLMDRDTRQPREVDVAVRIKGGSFEVLVILECRERVEVPDVRWIEELHGKGRSVGADRVVAVSTSGFTAPARSKARSLGIEVRTLRDVQDMTGWEKLLGFTARRVHESPSIYDVHLFAGPPLAPDEWPHPIPARASIDDDSFFLSGTTGRRFSLRDLVVAPEIYDQIHGKLAVGKPENLELTFRPHGVATDQWGDVRWATHVKAQVVMKREETEIQPRKIQRYVAGEMDLARRAEFEIGEGMIAKVTIWPSKRAARPRDSAGE